MFVSKNTLMRIIEEQQLDVQSLLARRNELCLRAELSQIDLQSPQAQVVAGVRGCGKSALCLLALAQAGIPFGYVSFDDESLAGLKADQLNDVLEALLAARGSPDVVFFDEIQNVPGWQLFVNRLLRRGMHVLITGSNARLLSHDLATHLTGRCNEIPLLPLSFREYCELHRVPPPEDRTTATEARLRAAFGKYLEEGGFPELAQLKNKSGYVSTLVRNILRRDIELRFSVRHAEAFERLAAHLLNVAPAAVSAPELAEIFDLKAAQTVRNYVSYLKQAFLLVGLKKFSFKSKVRLTQEKVYPVDVALMSERPDAFAGSNLGWRLETIVFLQLLRDCRPSGCDLYYLNERGGECDFLVCRGNRVLQAVQVSYDISSPRTRKREIKGLLLAARLTGCESLLLLTNAEYGEEEAEGHRIEIRPVYDWAGRSGRRIPGLGQASREAAG